MTTLSLVIPCYNELSTLPAIVAEVLKLASPELALEVLIVDDASTDGSLAAAEALAAAHPAVRVLRHERNRGKGAALRTGFLVASGDFVGVQDADLEYDPQDYLELLRTAQNSGCDVVFGSRYLPAGGRRVLRYWHSSMNRLLTRLSNWFSDLDLTDMETCYKLFRREVIADLAPQLRENRFGFEPEIVARLAKAMRRRAWQLAECPVRYRPRTFAEGKKIGVKDGLRALWCIVRYNLCGGRAERGA